MHTITIFYYKANDSRLYSWHRKCCTTYFVFNVYDNNPCTAYFRVFLNLKEPNIPKGIH